MLYLGIFLSGLLVGVLIDWVILAPFFKKAETANKEKNALEEFKRCVKLGKRDKLFVMNATELVGEANEEVHRLQALFANEHNEKLLAIWQATKKFKSFSFLEFDRRNPIHTAAVVMSAGLEQKFRNRDIRKSKGLRTRHQLEPDNLLIGLQTALTAREDIKNGLMTQMTMAPPSADGEDDE